MAQATVLDRLTVVLGWTYDEAGVKQFERGVKRVQGGLKSASAGMLKVGGSLVGAFASAAVTFGGMETGLAKIQALVGASDAQLKDYEQSVVGLAKETGVSAKSLVDGLYFITSAGYSGADAIELLRASAQGAVSQLGEMESIADLLTTVLATWQDMSPETTMDQLISTVRLGKLDPETLVSPLSMVLPFAAELGVSFNEVAGSLAFLSRKGLDASRGAEAMRGLLGKLIKPTVKGKKELASLGLEMAEVQAVFRERGIVEGLALIRDTLRGDSEKMGWVFQDVQALSAALLLSGEGAGEAAGIIDQVGSAAGDLQSAFEIMAATQGHKWRAMMVRFELLRYDLGERLAPTLERLMGIVEQAISWVNGLSESTKRWGARIVGAGPAVLALGAALRILAIAVGGYAKVAKFAGGLTVLLAKGLWTAASASRASALATKIDTAVKGKGIVVTKLAAAAQWLLNTAFLGFPIIGWIAALVAAGAAIYLFRDQIVGFLRTAWRWIKETFQNIEAYWPLIAYVLLGPVAAVGVAVWQHWDKITGFFKAVWDWIAGLWGGLVDVLTWPFRQLWAFLDQFDLFEMGKKLLDTLIEGIKATAGAVVAAVKGVFGKVRDLLPFSDARRGPLSDLTASGMALPATFATGVAAGAPAVDRAVRAALVASPGLLAAPVAGPARAAAPPPRQRAAALTVSIERIEIDAQGGDADDIAERVGDAIREEARSLVEEFDTISG